MGTFYESMGSLPLVVGLDLGVGSVHVCPLIVGGSVSIVMYWSASYIIEGFVRSMRFIVGSGAVVARFGGVAGVSPCGCGC